jgi:threonine aldolase
MKEDNAKAHRFAEIFSKSAKKASIDLDSVETNIILIQPNDKNTDIMKYISDIQSKGIRLSPGKRNTIRAVTHLDVTMEECEKAAHIAAEYFS